MPKQTPDDLLPEWDRRERPPTLSRRFQFNGYSQTRRFLDELAALVEECGYYPDTSFGTNYVNVTLHARNETTLEEKDFAYAARIDKLVSLLNSSKK